MSVLGNRVLRTEDRRMLTEGAHYVADLRSKNAAFVRFVRSVEAHGRLVSIDVEEARRSPGVLGVFTAADLELPDLAPIPMVDQRMPRPLLARDTVRFVGEPLAVVVAETAAAAADAAEQVIVDIEPRRAVVSLADAATDDALVHPDAGTNLAFALPGTEAAPSSLASTDAPAGIEPGSPTDVPETIDAERSSGRSDSPVGEVTVEASLVSQRLAAVPLEPRSAAAQWSPDGARLTFWASSQAPHRVRDTLADLYGLDPAAVRVIVPDVGGGFGAKGSPLPEELLLAGLSRAVGRPVTWTETRGENLTASVHGRAQSLRMRLGGTRMGRITRYELDITQDAGAYPMIGAFLPTLTHATFTGCYDIAVTAATGRSYVTNTSPVGAYRGAGRPEAIFCIERAVEMFAAKIGMDPAQVRRLNFVTPDQFPFEVPSGRVYDSGNYRAALEAALEAAGYEQLRAEQARRRAATDPMLLGVGIASYVESTSAGVSELGEIELAADGSLIVRTGATPYGQGHATCWSMLASEVTGVPMGRIRVISGDTEQIATSELTAGSRSAQLAGSAVHVAAGKLVDVARSRAAELLEAAEADLVLDFERGEFHVAGSPQPRISWADIGADAARRGCGPVAATSDFTQEANTFSFGCHVAVVEIDSHTGEAVLQRLVACDDAGTLINPLIAEGQLHGGMAQGAAQVLLEEARYSENGAPLATNLIDYPAITAPDLPSFEMLPMQTPTPLNPLGAKGIGESGTTGAGAAVYNAVCDALAQVGVDPVDMPATPQKIWQALSGRHSG